MTPDEERELTARCTRWLFRHEPVRPLDVARRLVAELEAEPVVADEYGEGGAVTALEQDVERLLGRPALFLPTGTMALQIAVRVLTDGNGRRSLGLHPTSHLHGPQLQAYAHLHRLNGVLLGSAEAPLLLADLQAAPADLGAVVLELPERELGGWLPSWDELVAMVSALRSRGTAVVIDGARLWECGPAYGRPYSELVALGDAAMVSFEKGLGGLPGCALVADAEVLAEARAWQVRHGGRARHAFLAATAARAALRDRLPRMPLYLEHARAIAALLRAEPRVRVVPDPPHTPLFHLWLQGTEEALEEGLRRVVDERRTWTWNGTRPTPNPKWRSVELAVGESTLASSPEEVADLVRTVVA